MSTFKVRVLKPKETNWFKIEGSNIAEAIQDYHLQEMNYHYSSRISWVTLYEINGEHHHFTRFETEDGQTIISRICESGIWRKGGVDMTDCPRTLEDIAQLLEVDLSLVEGPWIGEESWENARERISL